jgi:predicted nucleic acid-binding protein
LAEDDVVLADRRHRLEDLHGLVEERFCRERRRRLHRDEAEHLEQVGDDHVPERARLLVEGGAAVDRERLGDVDLDVVDVVSVPDRLEQAVREAKRQDVLDGLLAEEVVDPEDLLLGEHCVHRRVQRAG